jgi:putative alpha-1,2-mannosidase
MIGNDDCGQMSAWYIFSALGFYPVNPANGTFVLGSPQVLSATLHLSNGKTFQINAENYGPSTRYHQKRWLNGAALERESINFYEIISGGTLSFEMTGE